MRGIPSLITDIRKNVFTEVARMAYAGKGYEGVESDGKPIICKSQVVDGISLGILRYAVVFARLIHFEFLLVIDQECTISGKPGVDVIRIIIAAEGLTAHRRAGEGNGILSIQFLCLSIGYFRHTDSSIVISFPR